MTTEIKNGLGQTVPSDTLYHYTSMDGLRGIIEGNSLWASNIHYLNDTKEFTLGQSMISEAIKSSKKRLNPEKRSFFAAVDACPEIFTSDDVFVVSLSEVGDLLSQWRGYTPNGCGFSIGFSPTTLNLLAVNSGGLGLIKCIYDPAEQRRAAKDFVNSSIQNWTSSMASGGGARELGNSYRLHQFEFSITATFLACAMKDPSFAEEREWRLACVARAYEEIKFRGGRSFILPYTELKLPSSSGHPGKFEAPIRSLTVGPTPHEALSMKSAKRMLEGRGLTSVAVNSSSIPFRAW